MSRPAVFLDRDGTLIEDADYLESLEQIACYPWTADAIRLLNRAGLVTVVVTNQSAVGRGLIDEAFVQRAHDEISRRLALGSARIDAYYYCPHHPAAAVERYRQRCRCRKPAPGMIEAACRDLDLDPRRSWVIGDRWRDIRSGAEAGVRGIRLLTRERARTSPGTTPSVEPPDGVHADAILNNLMEAVGWILRATTSR